MIAYDALRPPSLFDPAIGAYKDWLHLNLFDHASGAVGLVNVSLHGAPHDLRSRAIGCALVHVPGFGWAGNSIVRGLDEATVGVASVAMEGLAIAVDHRAGTVLASAQLPSDEFALDVTATAVTPAINMEQRIPLGSGWISWFAVPRLDVVGSVTAAGRELDLQGASAYHDHSWGRWHWGEDLGWDWGAFLTPEEGPAFVLTRVTDRARSRVGEPHLSVHLGRTSWSFVGRDAVTITYEGRLETRLRRLPGAQAALHQDRRTPPLPASWRVVAEKEGDRIEIAFQPEGAAQLIAGDPIVKGYGFLHEMAGAFHASGSIEGREVSCSGLGVVEYVD